MHPIHTKTPLTVPTRHPTRLILVAGLPGSGKSTLLASRFFEAAQCFDDFMAGTSGNPAEFKNSPHLSEIVEALTDGKTVVMADIRFCEPEFRGEVLNLLTQVAGPFVTEWLCFENQPAVCKRNARHRARETGQRDYLQEEKSIERLTILYEPFPEGATVLQVKEATASLGLRIRSILQTFTRRSIPDRSPSAL